MIEELLGYGGKMVPNRFWKVGKIWKNILGSEVVGLPKLPIYSIINGNIH